MQRRAIRDAKTPDKMKKSKSVKEDSNLSLQEKKEKIQAGLKKLAELGTVDPKNKYQELINDIARVLTALGTQGQGLRDQLCLQGPLKSFPWEPVLSPVSVLPHAGYLFCSPD